jgi:hypothetical protein
VENPCYLGLSGERGDFGATFKFNVFQQMWEMALSWFPSSTGKILNTANVAFKFFETLNDFVPIPTQLALGPALSSTAQSQYNLSHESSLFLQ